MEERKRISCDVIFLFIVQNTGKGFFPLLISYYVQQTAHTDVELNAQNNCITHHNDDTTNNRIPLSLSLSNQTHIQSIIQ